MSDYDKARGRFRGASRSSSKEQHNNNVKTEKIITMKKNEELPGMTGKGVERVSIKALDLLVDKYVEARDERMALTKREVETADDLREGMHKYKDKLTVDKDGNIIYHYDDQVITLNKSKEKIKVRREKEETDGDDD